MIESLALAWALTLLFTGTAGYGLLRVSRTYAGARGEAASPDDRSTELSHLLMSIAMVAMVWMWGGAGTQIVQLVVFGGFTVVFLLRSGSALRTGGPRAGVAFGYHALMAGSMAWMVAAMTIMTGHRWSSGSAGHHHGSGASGLGGTGTEGDPVAPVWTVVVTVALVVGLLAASASWVRVVRGSATVPVPVSGGSVEKPGALSHHRAGALSHMLMGIGMAVMLLVMTS